MSHESTRQAIRAAIVLQNLTQWKVAQNLKISESFLSYVLSGRKPMPQDLEAKLVEMLNLGKTIDALSSRAEVGAE